MKFNSTEIETLKNYGTCAEQIADCMYLYGSELDLPSRANGYLYVLSENLHSTNKLTVPCNTIITAYSHWLQNDYKIPVAKDSYKLTSEMGDFYDKNQSVIHQISIGTNILKSVSKINNLISKEQMIFSEIMRLEVNNKMSFENIWLLNNLLSMSKNIENLKTMMSENICSNTK